MDILPPVRCGTWWKSRSDEEIPSRSFASVISNTFPRLFNLFIYESISNSFDYILFAPGVSIFAIKNGNTLRFARSEALPRVLSCNIKWGCMYTICSTRNIGVFIPSAFTSWKSSSAHPHPLYVCRHVTSNGNNMSGCVVLFMTAKDGQEFRPLSATYRSAELKTNPLGGSVLLCSYHLRGCIIHQPLKCTLLWQIALLVNLLVGFLQPVAQEIFIYIVVSWVVILLHSFINLETLKCFHQRKELIKDITQALAM